jgi:hypothetical protein
VTAKNRKFRPKLRLPTQPLFVLPSQPKLDAVPTEVSFHASLRDRIQAEMKRRIPSSPWLQRLHQLPRPSRGLLTRAYCWLHARYKSTATKRLRVHETVSLGEKRFVALLSVEGREFLIGGGSAGVSLLAQLGTAIEPAEKLQQELGVTGDSE